MHNKLNFASPKYLLKVVCIGFVDFRFSITGFFGFSDSSSQAFKAAIKLLGNNEYQSAMFQVIVPCGNRTIFHRISTSRRSGRTRAK